MYKTDDELANFLKSQICGHCIVFFSFLVCKCKSIKVKVMVLKSKFQRAIFALRRKAVLESQPQATPIPHFFSFHKK
jgi:hypothetical protein